MITYTKSATGIKVELNGAWVGTIRSVRDGWQYQPRTQGPRTSRMCGEVFSTVNECKRSIEGA